MSSALLSARSREEWPEGSYHGKGFGESDCVTFEISSVLRVECVRVPSNLHNTVIKEELESWLPSATDISKNALIM